MGNWTIKESNNKRTKFKHKLFRFIKERQVLVLPIFETSGVIRDLILVLHTGLIFYSILFAVILAWRWIRTPLRRLADIKLAWSLFFLGIALNSFCFIMSDFYFTTGLLRHLWVKSGYVAMMTALIGFYLALERVLPYRIHHGFSVTGVGTTLLTAAAPAEFMMLLALTAGGIASLGVILFFAHVVRITTGNTRRNMHLILVGFIIGFLGYIGRSDFLYYNLGENLYALSAFLLLFGLVVAGAGLIRSPTLDELDWHSQLMELYVIRSGGLLIFHHRFVESVAMDECFAAAGIEGIQSLIQEITRSEFELSELTLGESHILFAHGPSFTTVLISRKPYHILLDKVNEFTSKFQASYGQFLYSFSGSISEFSTAEDLVQELF